MRNVRTSMKFRLILLFVVFGFLALAVNMTATLVRLRNVLTAQAETRLREHSSRVYEMLESELGFAFETIDHFVSSHFLVNSLIDPSGRDLYLTPLAQELLKKKYVESVHVTDYRGEVIFPEAGTPDDFFRGKELRLALQVGERNRYIAGIEGKYKLISVDPILYYNTPQGACVVTVDLETLLAKTFEDIDGSSMIQVFYESLPLVSAMPLEDISEYKSFSFPPPPRYRLVNEMRIHLESGVLLSEFSRPTNELLLQLLSVNSIVLLLAAAFAVLMGRSFVNPILNLVKKIQSATSSEKPTQCHPVGTGDELEDLARAFDDLSLQLVDANRLLERKVQARTAKLMRSNQELEQFAYIASHDLQEPIRTIGSFVNLLDNGYSEVLDEDGRKYLAYCKDSAVRIRVLISDLLQYSKIGIEEASPEDVDLSDLMNTVLRDLSGRIEDTGAQVNVEPLPVVSGLPSQLHQLFLNLVGNALKYRRTNVVPEVSVFCSQNDEKVSVSIRDNGIGIPEEYQDKIFMIFQRLHSRNEYEGTGIGLAVCRRIIDRHNGAIRVESRFGSGSTFTVELPKVHKGGGE